jgi:hypothetical protein
MDKLRKKREKYFFKKKKVYKNQVIIKLNKINVLYGKTQESMIKGINIHLNKHFYYQKENEKKILNK